VWRREESGIHALELVAGESARYENLDKKREIPSERRTCGELLAKPTMPHVTFRMVLY
jgi:hypothetical protein